MNKRVLQCGTSSVYAIGEEGSFVDRKEKADYCFLCLGKCEYKHTNTKEFYMSPQELQKKEDK